MTAMVEVRGLKKTFTRADGTPVHAVKGVSFDIQKGEIFSLLGPNGAGKSTTIGMISGLVSPSEGEARIGGHSITGAPMQAKGLIGVVPQDIALYPQLSPRQNLDFFGRMYGLNGAGLSKAIDEVLEFIDLKDRQHDRIETFSGGMKRRVNIGVGLLHKPQLVYMDEPTVGVDPQSRRRILDTVFRMRDEYNMTVLYTTHLMEESQELSDRVAIIDHGTIIAMGTQVELMAQAGEEDRLVLSVTGKVADDLVAKLGTVVGVSKAVREPAEDGVEETRLSVYAKSGRKTLPDVLRAANDIGLDIASVAVKEPDLETLFLNLTGRALRD